MLLYLCAQTTVYVSTHEIKEKQRCTHSIKITEIIFSKTIFANNPLSVFTLKHFVFWVYHRPSTTTNEITLKTETC